MSTPTPANQVKVASVSDRGLNDKRPLNEDSFLSDQERGIFAVADGVGGAEAGEVASQTAVDVLSEAFRHRINDGDDVEDLMELAIQRANASIHQMANEHPRFSMMATTIVALHVDGLRATFGHVGDSRLYRLTSKGEFRRETEDHSIVEEEVRAGRMTPEQAQNHPSKNVISRALGAEPSVEVDMQTIEIEDGTSFLLCTDGITRHIPDNELRDLVLSGQPIEAVCEEMKRRCYERGAEDNLTAVIVQVGTPKHTAAADVERTVDAKLPPELHRTTPDVAEPRVLLTPASRIAFPGPENQPLAAPAVVAAEQEAATGGRAVRRFFGFVFVLALIAAAFYAGTRYPDIRRILNLNAAPAVQPTPSQSPLPDTRASFDTKRAAVDADPHKWLAENVNAGSRPFESKDPEFLYLYGRAQMLTGNHRDAGQALDLAIANYQTAAAAPLSLQAEVKLAQAAAALKQSSFATGAPTQDALAGQQKAATILDELLGVKGQTAPK
ncbi:MAG TPA: PP2C family serine/threonine-protein phosphatase [Pyrinomonadaceae bacterium]|nr:PP2C family serine/threonine-protein phosphatase [Pyrinomonadaceae bacterium]